MFSLEGAVKNSGLVEIPFGLTLREMIYGIGGGIHADRRSKRSRPAALPAAASRRHSWI
jgi:NADH:ubiquinone oxidoreductase subunit F (NADH-binding)